MDFKHQQNGNHHTQGHASYTSQSTPSGHHHNVHNMHNVHNIPNNVHHMHNSSNSKQSPQKGKFRRRCRSECLSPVLGGQHIERYNLRTHHHSKDEYNTYTSTSKPQNTQHKQYISKSSSYYPGDSFAAVNYDDWRPSKQEGESPPHSRDHKENQLQNGHRAPITDLRDIYGQQEYKKKLRHHQNFQVYLLFFLNFI